MQNRVGAVKMFNAFSDMLVVDINTKISWLKWTSILYPWIISDGLEKVKGREDANQ